MAHPYSELAPEYIRRLASMSIVSSGAIGLAATRALRNKTRYVAVTQKTGVPAALIAALHYRESNYDFATGLGQGDPIDKVSTHVPAGHGPFGSWEEAAIFYLHFDRMDENSQPWSMPYCCWKLEAWNGFGPRAHGRASGYLWSGTNQYDGGKYVADSVWDPSHWDQQLGAVPIIKEIMSLDPSMAFGGPGGAVLPINVPPAVTLPPISVGGDKTKSVQQTLNKLGYGPLVLDGSYGRRTRGAVRRFQADNGLKADGLLGPITGAALVEKLAEYLKLNPN